MTNKENKSRSLLVVILGTLSIPSFIYSLRVYGEVIGKSSSFIRINYHVDGSSWIIFLVPLFLFSAILFSYAKVEDFFLLKVIKYHKKHAILKVVNIFCLVFVLLLFAYNVFCIYVYVEHIGTNPFLTWEEFVDFRK